jgi:heterodisulfide reductase subunit A
VITLLQLEQRLAAPSPAIPDTTVFIQCVGSREGETMYCSRLCCSTAVKQAIRIKKAKPDSNVIVLYRDIRTYGFREKYYGEARDLGVSFIRYDLDGKPVVAAAARAKPGSGHARGKASSPALRVSVVDHILGAELVIPAGLVVLSARVDPNPDNEPLSQLFKVPLTSNGFFLEAHAKLRPVDFATEGVFVCGAAHYPKDSSECIAQAKAAAGRAATVLAQESILAEGKTSFVRESRCVACGACIAVCPYRAIEMDEAKNVAKINEVLCKGCGICTATCRSSAIDLRGFRDEQILAVLKVVRWPETTEAVSSEAAR